MSVPLSLSYYPCILSMPMSSVFIILICQPSVIYNVFPYWNVVLVVLIAFWP